MTPLFVELCAGTAALSLRLQGGNRCRPVVSRIGAKTGYANVILSCFGLAPGGKAAAYLWCEPDDGVRGLLMAYAQPTVLREAAAILRSWKDEEPRALWERLRAELKAGAAVEGAEGVAKLCMVIGSSFGGDEDRYSGWFNAQGPAACEWLGVSYIARLIAEHGRDTKGRPQAKSAGHPDVMAPRLEDMAQRTYPPIFIARDGRAVTPEEVARFMVTTRWTLGDGAKRVAPGVAPVAIVSAGRVVTPEEVAGWCFVQKLTRRGAAWGAACDLEGNGGANPRTGERHAFTFARNTIPLDMVIEWPHITITDDAKTIAPPKLPPGVICYMDPPYLNTTGYKHDLPRSEVVRLARLWADAGAFVGVSEQAPIPELVADGWHTVRITNGRKGAARTFSKQQDEWLTLSRPPVNPPLLGAQESLL